MKDQLGKPVTISHGQPRINPSTTRPLVEESSPPPHPKKKGVEVKTKSLQEASFQFTKRAIGAMARFFNLPERRVVYIIISLVAPLLEVGLLLKSEHPNPLTHA